MKKLLFIFLIACGALNAQTAYPYVQRNQLLTSGRVPFVTTNGIVTDISTFGFNSGTGVLSTPVLSVSGISGLGIATSSTTNLNLAAGTTGVSSLRMPHGAAPTSPVNGDMWSTTAGFFGRVNGATVGPFGVGGSGTVTVVGAGSLTSTALVTGGGSQTLQTPAATATMDSSGNISTPGTLTVGNAATTAGAIALTQGTTQSTGTTNITIQAPAAVTSYIRTLPAAVGSTGFLLETVSGSVQTESLVAGTGSGNVVRATNPTVQSPTYTVAAIGASAIDWAAGDYFTKTLSANTTFTFSNAATGKQIVVAVTNTASNYTVTWPTVSWSGGTPPTQTVGAKTDIYTFIQIGSTIYGSVVQNF